MAREKQKCYTTNLIEKEFVGKAILATCPADQQNMLGSQKAAISLSRVWDLEQTWKRWDNRSQC